MRTCQVCGEENPDRARFCLACGGEIHEAGSFREIRKIVTVLFCDVTGSTALGVRLDPESLRRVMTRYFEVMSVAVARHGGTVEKFIGDAVVAVFGVPFIHEDDALRGVRAASDMRSSLEELNEELRRDHGVTLEARIGVNTGPVVAGDPSAGQALVTGDTVNTAARLEQGATAGDILIGEPTYRLVRDAAAAEPVEPLHVKGKDDPVVAYRLLSVSPRAEAPARRTDTELVGRDREGYLLGQAYERAIAERSCALFTIVGAAGIGKTRLVREFLNGIEPDSIVLSARCLSYGEGVAVTPIVDVIEQALDKAGADGADAGSRLASILASEEAGDEIAGVLSGVLADHEAALADRETLYWALRRFVETLAMRKPVTLFFDDVHWAEPNLLDAVEHIADWSRGAGILLICAGRSELLDARPSWGGGKLNATAISLESLTGAETRRLVANLLGDPVSDDVVLGIVEAAEGNPLFAEELLSVLIEDGYVVREERRWVAVKDVAEMRAPATIQAMIAARLDRLDAGERMTLEEAAVAGKMFWDAAVLAVAGERQTVLSDLQALVRKDLIRPARSDLRGMKAYSFRHNLVRDTAYEGLTKQARSVLHARFAAWLEADEEASGRDHGDAIAFHLDQALRARADLGPLDDEAKALVARAAGRLTDAGKRAMSRGEVRVAAGHLRRAMELLPDDRGREARFALAMAEGALGESSVAEDLFRRSAEDSRRLGDEGGEWLARLELAVIRFHRNELSTETVEGEARSAIEIFTRLHDEAGLARAWRVDGQVHNMRGSFGAMTESYERARLHARRAADPVEEGEAMFWLTFGLVFGSAPFSEAFNFTRSILAEPRLSRRIRADALRLLGLAEAAAEHPDVAGEAFREARALYEDLGLSDGLLATYAFWGNAARLAEDFAAAESRFRSGVAAARHAGQQSVEGYVTAMLAIAVAEQGRSDEALQLARAAAVMSAGDDLANLLFAKLAEAKALFHLGDYVEAAASASETVEMASRTDDFWTLGETHLTLGRALAALERSEEAGVAFERAVSLFEKKELPSRLRIAKGELSRMRGRTA